MIVHPGILTGLGLLAFVGLVAVLGILGAWLLSPPSDDQPSLPDVAPTPAEPVVADVTNVRVLRPGDRPRLMHDPDNCAVCAGIDRSGF